MKPRATWKSCYRKEPRKLLQRAVENEVAEYLEKTPRATNR